MSDVKRIVRVSPGTLYRDLQGEAILLHLETGEYFGLDEVGHRIWQLIMEDGDLGHVEEMLLSEYRVDRDVLSADIERLVDELAAKKLVEIEIQPPQS